MLSSSGEYLSALRGGNYLRFLDWPLFIAQHYSSSNLLEHSGDKMVDFLIFDWLNNGFSEEDVKHIALLYKIQGLRSRPLRGDLEYALIAISAAAIQCMIYQNTDVASKYLCKDKKNNKEVVELMEANSKYLDPSAREKSFNEQNSRFLAWVDEVSAERVRPILQVINPVLELKYCIADYLYALEKAKVPHDELKQSRISVIRRLAQYINEQTAVTEAVRNELTQYSAKLRELRPEKFEEGYLEIISPKSISATWRFITDLGLGFFQILQASAVVPEEPGVKPGAKV